MVDLKSPPASQHEISKFFVCDLVRRFRIRVADHHHTFVYRDDRVGSKQYCIRQVNLSDKRLGLQRFSNVRNAINSFHEPMGRKKSRKLRGDYSIQSSDCFKRHRPVTRVDFWIKVNSSVANDLQFAKGFRSLGKEHALGLEYADRSFPVIDRLLSENPFVFRRVRVVMPKRNH